MLAMSVESATRQSTRTHNPASRRRYRFGTVYVPQRFPVISFSRRQHLIPYINLCTMILRMNNVFMIQHHVVGDRSSYQSVLRAANSATNNDEKTIGFRG